MEFGEQEQEKYREYAGKIICIGELISDPENKYDENPSRMSYADIGNLQLLEEPIASKEISDYLPLNRFGSVTAVKQEQWAILKKLILERNPSISL